MNEPFSLINIKLNYKAATDDGSKVITKPVLISLLNTLWLINKYGKFKKKCINSIFFSALIEYFNLLKLRKIKKQNFKI